jgi:hypothetical protein
MSEEHRQGTRSDECLFWTRWEVKGNHLFVGGEEVNRKKLNEVRRSMKNKGERE